jgi:hypothetical protein
VLIDLCIEFWEWRASVVYNSDPTHCLSDLLPYWFHCSFTAFVANWFCRLYLACYSLLNGEVWISSSLFCGWWWDKLATLTIQRARCGPCLCCNLVDVATSTQPCWRGPWQPNPSDALIIYLLHLWLLLLQFSCLAQWRWWLRTQRFSTRPRSTQVLAALRQWGLSLTASPEGNSYFYPIS